MNKKLICCWGDSITEGAWMEPDETYPAFLQQELGEGYLVLNGGSGGERTETIMARQGAHHTYLKNEVVFPAGCAELQLGNTDDNGMRTEEDETLRLTLYLGNGIPVNPLTIAGEKFSLRHADWNWTPLSGALMLSRTDTAEELRLPAGSEVFFDSVKYQKKADWDIFYMGANGKYRDYEDLFRQQKEFAARLCSAHYILMLPHFLPDWDARYIAEFGEEHTFAQRAYLASEQAFADAGLAPTAEDRTYMAEGKIPPAFTYSPGNCHLNACGYKTLAHRLAQKILAQEK